MKKSVHNEEPASAEVKHWLTILDELRQMNIILKNRLVNALQQEVNRSFIETAEQYHQQFIDKDQLIRLLRHDITGLLEDGLHGSGETSLWLNRFCTLERDMQRIITEFSGMKAAFEYYLSGKDVRVTGA